jgi:hypothetical protein
MNPFMLEINSISRSLSTTPLMSLIDNHSSVGPSVNTETTVLNVANISPKVSPPHTLYRIQSLSREICTRCGLECEVSDAVPSTH